MTSYQLPVTSVGVWRVVSLALSGLFHKYYHGTYGTIYLALLLYWYCLWFTESPGMTLMLQSASNTALDSYCSVAPVNSFRTAVPFWGQTSQISSGLSPIRDCGSKGVKCIVASGMSSPCTAVVLIASTWVLRTCSSTIHNIMICRLY